MLRSKAKAVPFENWIACLILSLHVSDRTSGVMGPECVSGFALMVSLGCKFVICCTAEPKLLKDFKSLRYVNQIPLRAQKKFTPTNDFLEIYLYS